MSEAPRKTEAQGLQRGRGTPPRTAPDSKPRSTPKGTKDKPFEVTTWERTQLRALEAEMRVNSHDVAVLRPNDMLHLWLTGQREGGATEEDALSALNIKLDEWGLSEHKSQIREYLKSAATGDAAALQDVRLMRRLVDDLRKTGGYLQKCTYKVIKGQEYVILKGHAGLRKTLNSTKYLVKNTKVVNMGLGKFGAAKSVRSGAWLSLFLTVGFNGLDLLMRDEPLWADFIGQTAGDLTKVFLSAAGASFLASLAVGGATAASLAVGPIFVAIVSGVAIARALDRADEEWGLTRSLIEAMREAEKNIRDTTDRLEREYRWYTRDPYHEFQFWMRMFGAQY